jgi:non-specific serine/threonine protein kinase
LTGPGGVGKTRLALAIAQDVAAHFADGATWVDLAPLADPALVPTMVAAALSTTPTADQSVREAIVGQQRSRQCLLILDNCEHLLEATADLSSILLAGCAAVQVLATSRVPLHLRGEHVLAVPPLEVPRLPTAPLEVVRAAPAVALFGQRARAADARFTLTADNAATVGEVCRQLDGLPLAIELAAARVSHFAPAALLDLLADRLQLLTGGPRDAPARQQTLRATLAWSHDLLSSAEQIRFRRLAVFVGGFDLAAATAVTGDDPHAVLEGLATLIDQSLLVRLEHPDGSARFTLLETVRAYALEQLTASGEEAAIRQAHATHFLAVAERAVLHTDAFWPNRLQIEHDNLRAALTWLADQRQDEALLQLAATLAEFWDYGGFQFEGRAWLERALARSLSVESPARARALRFAGAMANEQSEALPGEARLRESLALARRLGVDDEVGCVLENLGVAAEDRGDYDRAEGYLREAVIASAIANELYMVANSLAHLGVVAYGRGDLTAATDQLQAALAAWPGPGHAVPTFVAHLYLAHVACTHGDLDQAAAHCREVLAIVEPWDRHGLARVAPGVALLAAARGQPAAALRLFGAAEGLREAIGLLPALPERAVYARAVASLRATLPPQEVAALWADGRAMPPEEITAVAQALASSTPAPDAGLPTRASPPRPAVEALALTRREREILGLLCHRLTDPEIAEQLFLSPRTASKHVGNILGKLGVSSRRDAAAMAVRQGLV